MRRRSVLRWIAVGRKAFALLSILLVACAPEAGVVDVAVLQWDPAEGVYDLRPATIETLSDVRALRGEAATAVGDSTILLDSGRLARARTEDELREAILDDPGSPVQAEYVEVDGVLYPSDFHSLNLATAYFNFEQARFYALERGLSPEKLRGIRFHYFPDVRLGPLGSGRARDNAAFFPLLQSFLLFPHDKLQDIPLAMNLGVVAHEYGHALFHAEVHEEAGLPTYPSAWCPGGLCQDPRGPRMLGILDEGYADAWGVGVTRDPLFSHHSFSQMGDARVSAGFQLNRHCYSQEHFERDLRSSGSMSPDDQEDYWMSRQYQVGTMVAGALYQAGCWQIFQGSGSCSDRCLGEGDWSRYDQVMDALFRSYAGEDGLAALLASDPSGAAAGQFAQVARTVIGAADDAAVRRSLCAAWMDRLALPAASLGGLCDDVTPTTLCSGPVPSGFTGCIGLRRGGPR